MPDSVADRPLERAATIEIRLSQPQQLFNSLDPSPFHERDLDQDAEAYIVDSADEYPLKSPLMLVIYLPADQIQDDARGLAQAAGPRGETPMSLENVVNVDPPIEAVREAVKRAFEEDVLPLGDISGSLIAPEETAQFAFMARRRGVVAGRLCAVESFAATDPSMVRSLRSTNSSPT